MRVLGIETSCDETAAATWEDGRLVSHVVASQIAAHRPYGGVVPEVASRKHLESIRPVVDEALAKAGWEARSLDGVAATRGPGLLGALLVGVTFAKGLALSLDLPFVGVNHVLAHVHAAFLEREMVFPFLALVISGGHTDLIRFQGPLEAEVIGRSLDDAVGEAFDKVARVLDLPYPGGPHLEQLAQTGDPAAVHLPPVRLGPERPFDFSFSGVKTAARRALEKGARPEDVAKAFQDAAISHLAETTRRALGPGDKMLVVAGGVAANSALRAAFKEIFCDLDLAFPTPAFSTDNAAMIARVGWERLRRNERDPMDLSPEPVITPFRHEGPPTRPGGTGRLPKGEVK